MGLGSQFLSNQGVIKRQPLLIDFLNYSSLLPEAMYGNCYLVLYFTQCFLDLGNTCTMNATITNNVFSLTLLLPLCALTFTSIIEVTFIVVIYEHADNINMNMNINSLKMSFIHREKYNE